MGRSSREQDEESEKHVVLPRGEIPRIYPGDVESLATLNGQNDDIGDDETEYDGFRPPSILACRFTADHQGTYVQRKSACIALLTALLELNMHSVLPLSPGSGGMGPGRGGGMLTPTSSLRISYSSSPFLISPSSSCHCPSSFSSSRSCPPRLTTLTLALRSVRETFRKVSLRPIELANLTGVDVRASPCSSYTLLEGCRRCPPPRVGTGSEVSRSWSTPSPRSSTLELRSSIEASDVSEGK